MKSSLPTVQKLAARLRDRLPVRALGLVPAHAFFGRKVDIPEGLSREEKNAFLELFLESKAPFPIEQLMWGFVSSANGSSAFVYATPKVRLRQLGMEDPQAFSQLLPGFLVKLGDVFDQPTVRFIVNGPAISAVFQDAGEAIPGKVISRPLPSIAPTDDALLELRKQLLDSLQLDGHEPEDGLWVVDSIAIDDNFNCSAVVRHLAANASSASLVHSILLLGDALWDADLRDAEYAGTERQNRRRSAILWKALRLAGLAAVLLLIFNAAGLGLTAFNSYREATIDRLSAQAIRVENKFTLANRLTESTEEDIRPFALVEAINPVRPDSIYYIRTRSRGFNRLEIEGESEQGVNPVNEFAAALEQLPFMASVEQNVQTRNNQTSFTFTLRFSQLPPSANQPLIVPEESTAASDEEEPQTEEN